MTLFAVLIFIAATALLALVLYVMMRREQPSRLARAVEAYGLVVLVAAWVFLLIGLVRGIFAG
ncbi:hypothetical protein [Tomitella gaofuii]|uniref:hypothetical protein n=1 Tax=Tomitella gaofuii TaxID=2760083 RepID=UPI0015FAEF46|nr:hypothetical protein [Tomitella gaofuii]